MCDAMLWHVRHGQSHKRNALFFSCCQSFPYQKKSVCHVSGWFQSVPTLSAPSYSLIQRYSEYPNYFSQLCVSWLIGQCYCSLRTSRIWLAHIPRQFPSLFGPNFLIYKHFLVYLLKFKSWQPSNICIYSACASIPTKPRGIEESKPRIWTPQVCVPLLY